MAIQGKEQPLNISEAAEYLGLTVGTVYKMTSAGRITHYKPNGGRIYFKQEDLDEYLFRVKKEADYVLDERAAVLATGGRR